MCYFCSPDCDSCYPKAVPCPQCGVLNYLKADACSQCGAEIGQGIKDAAVAEWEQGRRFFSSKKSAEPPEFARKMKERMNARKKD